MVFFIIVLHLLADWLGLELVDAWLINVIAQVGS